VISARRRVARCVLATVVLLCVVAGTVPAALELARSGAAVWTSTAPFRDGRTGDD
jgi:hypothetical protein